MEYLSEGPFLIMIDAEERRCRKEIGLDTQIPYTVNDEWQEFVSLIRVLMLTAMTIPPCKYTRKSENIKISRF